MKNKWQFFWNFENISKDSVISTRRFINPQSRVHYIMPCNGICRKYKATRPSRPQYTLWPRTKEMHHVWHLYDVGRQSLSLLQWTFEIKTKRGIWQEAIDENKKCSEDLRSSPCTFCILPDPNHHLLLSGLLTNSILSIILSSFNFLPALFAKWDSCPVLMILNRALDVCQCNFHVLRIAYVTHSHFHEINGMLGGNLKLFVKSLFDQSHLIFNLGIVTVVFRIFSAPVCISFHAIQFDFVTLKEITHDGMCQVISDIQHTITRFS